MYDYKVFSELVSIRDKVKSKTYHSLESTYVKRKDMSAEQITRIVFEIVFEELEELARWRAGD